FKDCPTVGYFAPEGVQSFVAKLAKVLGPPLPGGGWPSVFPARSPLGGQFVTLGSLSPTPPVIDDECMQVNSCRSVVLDAVEALPALERETLALVYYRGMSCDEVADTMQISVATVRDRLHEGARRLLAGVGDL
ncbi:RNA polymerase sigma factor, partial [Rhodococcus opacus]